MGKWYNMHMAVVRITALFCFAVACVPAIADTWGRYKIVGSYMTEASDGTPGIYFQTVAEQGGENAAYAVVGGVYPMRASTVTGEIVIPEMLEGVPVRKIADGAFVGQTRITAVTLPASLREIGDRAFGFCTSLQSITFAGEGLTSVGCQCFSNCVSLVTVSFPATLSYLAPEAFVLCDKLEAVSFEGSAPLLDPPTRDTQLSYLGEKRWTGVAPARAVVHVREGSYGWLAPYRGDKPDRWPLSHGFMNAHPLVVDPRPKSGFSVHIAARREP